MKKRIIIGMLSAMTFLAASNVNAATAEASTVEMAVVAKGKEKSSKKLKKNAKNYKKLARVNRQQARVVSLQEQAAKKQKQLQKKEAKARKSIK